ncbi:hypothetical protein GALMADRAFT_246948 [Galerina marginata CBS 339.88]|uniref:F-box domain-containing protein n=1 Tax=Galerina marginata (strain CBS 339.88) TaxID=685588 RepID=A0A067T9I5_GALM3|nr:hypothetical protein GALMADRAFT_246948 [Galerina marginata CBS 339.88]
MSETRQSPLVDRRFHLPQDVLWYTFFFVVQPPINRTRSAEHSALNDLRHLSQVCASWRELLLASSSLWGMAFELDQLLQNTCHWRNEVLRRTGNSLLNIHCHITTEGIGVLEIFLKSFLDEHWPRIRNLDIRLEGFSTIEGDRFMRRTIGAFRKPAVNLESFTVNLGRYSKRTPVNARLFADQAPVLQEFTGYNFRINPHSPWFSNLRVLRITCIWTAHELLGTLASMPLLEILEFNEGGNGEGAAALLDPPVMGRDSLPRAVLSQLKELDLDLGMALAKHVAVLEHLVPAPGLQFDLKSDVLSLPSADLVAVQHVLCSYLQFSFKNELPNDVKIIIDRDYILVYLSKGSSKFTFELEFDHDVPDITTLLEPISSISLENSTKLSININSGALAATNTALSRILLSSASIKELNTSAYSLQFPLSLSLTTDTVLFPILELLRLDWPHDVRHVLDFLSRRYAQDAPIQLLDFGDCRAADSCDFRCLEQFNGLRVRWKDTGGSTKEYTCGSGNAQVLDFTQNLPEP